MEGLTKLECMSMTFFQVSLIFLSMDNLNKFNSAPTEKVDY